MPVNVQKAQDNWERFEEARDAHVEFVEIADECVDFYTGLGQWEAKIKTQLEAKKIPALTLNKFFAVMNAIFGSQIESQADISFRPQKDATQGTADALSAVYLQIHNLNRMWWLEATMASDALLMGRGYYDARVDFDDNLEGDVIIDKLDPRDVVLSKHATSYDPDKWPEVFVTRWLTPEEIEADYGKEAADYLKRINRSRFGDMGWDSIRSAPSGQFGDRDDDGTGFFSDPDDIKQKRLIRVLERQYRTVETVPHFVDPETGEIIRVPPKWDEAKIQNTAQHQGLIVIRKQRNVVRWLVTAEDFILHDEISPYRNFTIIPYFPHFQNGKTIGYGQVMKQIQEALNKVLSQMLHVVNSTANGGWKLKQNSLRNMDEDELSKRGAETGLVMILDDINNAEKIQPNQMPSGLERIGFVLDNMLDEVAGSPESARGFDRADVSAKAIQSKQAASTVNLARAMLNLTYTRYLLAEHVLNLVQAFYTEPRVIQVVGDGLLPADTEGGEPQEVGINQPDDITGELLNDLTIGKYAVVVTPVPSRNTMADTEFQEALALRKEGIAIPDDVLIEASHLRRRKQIAERVRQLQGGGDPTEAQKAAAEMEQQLKQAEVSKTNAEAKLREAEAALKMVEARIAAAEIEGGQAAEQAKLQLEAQKAEVEMNLKQAQAVMDMQLKQAAAKQEMEMKREAIQAQIAGARELAGAKVEESEETSEAKIEVIDTESDAKIAVAEKESEAKIKREDAQAKAAAKRPQPKPTSGSKK